jgi:glutamine synthetase
VDVDPGNFSDDERAQRGIKRLPQTLGAALDALEADTVLTEALGPTLAEAYLAVKRLESRYFGDKSPEDEARQHFDKY